VRRVLGGGSTEQAGSDVTDGRSEPRPTVVLVDDSDEVRGLVRARLELSGLFEIVGEGKDGAEAISLAYRHEPSAMLLDMSMPTMDGLEALPAVLTLAPETRVVVYTGFEEHGLAAQARDLGAIGFIEKSLPIGELPDELWRIVEGAGPVPRPRQGLRVVTRTDQAAADDQAILDEHLERFREVFDQAAIGMATLTLSGSIVRANAALAEMMGAHPDDLVGVDYGRLTRGEGEVLDRSLEAIGALGDDLTSFEHPLPVGEEPRVLRVTLAPIRDSKGDPLYVFAQVQDISAQRYAEDELRRSEERFRLLVTEVAEYAIFMLDPEGHVGSWNAGAQRIKGYSAEEIVGQHFRVFYPPEEQESRHPEQNLANARRDGEYAEEGWRVRKDGSRFWARVVITAVYDANGRHLGFAKVTRDQSEQRAYEEQHRQAVEQQVHLLAVTAHELRTPTAVIDGSAALLHDHADDLSPEQREKLLTGIVASAHRLQRLVSDMAAASRAQRDALTLRLGQVSLRDVLTQTVERANVAHPSAEITMECDGDPIFEADAGRLGQAIDNLIDNAVRHGSPPIALHGDATDEGVRIRVSDVGDGVAEELLPRLFERFAIAGPGGGTGLGLYLVREIVRGHGGDVRYQAPVGGEPPSFDLVLPVHADRPLV
jgi:PAS domain S-box-containing protein